MRGLLFVLVSSLAFFLAYFLRSTVYGFDSYHYVNLFGLSTPMVAVLCFLSFLATGIIFYYIAGKKVTPWFLALGSPAWLIHFFKFENELLAMPFIMLAIYFYLKEKDFHAIACLIPAGLIFKGSVVYLLAFVPASWLYVILSSAVIIFSAPEWNFLLPISNVVESHFLTNTIYWGFLYIPFLKMLGDWFHDKQKPKTRLEKATFLLCVMGVLSGRWVPFAVPFLALMLRDWLDRKGATPYLIVLLGTIVLFGSMWFVLLTGPPMPADFDLIREGERIAWIEDLPLKNTWPVGYWVESMFPGRSTARAGGNWVQDFNNSVVITHSPLDDSWKSKFEGCEGVRREKYSELYFCCAKCYT